MKFHPYSEIFTLLEGSALDELVADIKAFGLREKIWLYDGMILDGRNRHAACQKAKVKPEYRTFKGTEQGALAFVVSANIHRRQLTTEQRAMAAARIATLRQGANQNSPKNIGSEATHASRDAPSQQDAADSLGVSRSSVQRARKVLDEGSKALQKAAEAGEVSLKKAAAVTNLPKSEQLAAATAEAEPDGPDLPTEDEMAELDAAAEREYHDSIAKVMDSDDRLAAANAEIKRQAQTIVGLKRECDGFMRGKSEVLGIVATRDRTISKLERRIKDLERENDSLKERVAVMEE